MRADGKSATDVKRKTGVPARTQWDMLYKYPQHTDRRPGQRRTNHPPKIDLEAMPKMERHIQNSYKKRTLNWVSLGSKRAVSDDWQTIKKYMNS